MNSSIFVLKGNEIHNILKNKEREIINLVKNAYLTYSKGDSSLPHSTFLTFPNDNKNRIISLIGYLGGEFNIAGMKWIASFPNNIKKGIERASAVLILNSVDNGRPIAFMESSVISANRTAASAALAAQLLWRKDVSPTLGLIGTGLINFEIMKYLFSVFPNIQKVYLYDLNSQRANDFAKKARQSLSANVTYEVLSDMGEVCKNSSLISFATTASFPYVNNNELCQENKIILHISLRDIAPEILLNANNIVDDIDHVNRANTSVNLTYKKVGNLNFINGEITDLFNSEFVKSLNNNLTIFSPFGLGILDLALGQFVLEESRNFNIETIKDFFPLPWYERNYE